MASGGAASAASHAWSRWVHVTRSTLSPRKAKSSAFSPSLLPAFLHKTITCSCRCVRVSEDQDASCWRAQSPLVLPGRQAAGMTRWGNFNLTHPRGPQTGVAAAGLERDSRRSAGRGFGLAASVRLCRWRGGLRSLKPTTPLCCLVSLTPPLPARAASPLRLL